MAFLPAAWSAWAEEHADLLQGLGLALAAASVLAILAFPLVLRRLPRDWFLQEKSAGPPPRRLLRNALGLILVLLGVLMLVLPGQGLLTILVGLGMVDFPGRHRLIRRAVRGERLRRVLNRLRGPAGPFRFEGEESVPEESRSPPAEPGRPGGGPSGGA